MKHEPHFILTIACADTVGIVAAVAGFLSDRGAFITESQHFGDADTGRFFMRTVFRGAGKTPLTLDFLRAAFSRIGEAFAMTWAIHDGTAKPRVLIAVSKFSHCLNDILHRWHNNHLQIEIPAIVSNHPDTRALSEWHGIPYHHLPVDASNKAEQESRIVALVDELNIDFVILARYMQVLSPQLCERLAWRCINIHHSFLPSFKGAKPYHQAHARGVKLIGATAHYVTSNLDEGPIIEQSTERVDHSMGPDDLVAIGRDIESVVLSRAIKWESERRVFPNGSKTIVFK